MEVLELDGDAGPPLGVLPEARYGAASIRLRAGDALVLHTDGVEEARDPAGAFFGREGIRRALLDCSGEPDCLIDTLRARVLRHEAGRPAGDDQTVLAMTVDAVGGG